MYISNLIIDNFRNYKHQEIEFSKGINVFYGKNGQGKTNIIEAIYMMAIGKSFRGVKDPDLVNRESNMFSISSLMKEDITDSIAVVFNEKKEKSIKVNGLYLRKLGHLMGSLLAVLFCPEDMQLISEGPGERRKFVDIAISQIKPSYYFELQKYNKILFQKNALLRDINRKFKNSRDMLCVWNEQLAESGSSIIKERKNFICEIEKYAKDDHYNISGCEEMIRLKYNCQYSEKEELIEQMNIRQEKEIEREMSLVGPHRDDFDILLNDIDLKKFGSQGQKRTVVLSLKLAEHEIIKNRTGRMPILIMDDVFSELDLSRQKGIFECIKDSQVFITTNEINDHIRDKSNLYMIKNGSVVL